MILDLAADSPSMRDRYLVRSTAGLAYLKALDIALKVFGRSSHSGPTPMRRILLGVGGHLGDAVIATGVIPAIVSAFPEVDIGVAAPSWAHAAFEGHPAIRWIHRVDHWKLNRGSLGTLGRVRRSVATHRTALAEIRAVGYDASVDLYPYYPTMAVLFARAGIPTRVGYESGGGGPANTKRIGWSTESGHMMRKQLRLVTALIGHEHQELRYDLPPVRQADAEGAAALLSSANLSTGYFVLHPGTGDPLKAWPLDRWLAVATALVRGGHRVLVTGAGAKEKEAAEWLRLRAPAIVDFSNRTNVGQLRLILGRASVVIASDSAAGHLAAAEGTPVVTIMAAIGDPDQWQPISSVGVVLMGNDLRSPDLESGGVAAVHSDVSVEAVLRAAIQLFTGARDGVRARD